MKSPHTPFFCLVLALSIALGETNAQVVISELSTDNTKYEDEDTEETLYPKILSTDELKKMMHEQDSVLSF